MTVKHVHQEMQQNLDNPVIKILIKKETPMIKYLYMPLICFVFSGVAFGENIKLPSTESLKGWKQTMPGISATNGILKVSVPLASKKKGLLGIWKQFRMSKFANKTVSVSVEMKGSNVASYGKYGGAKLMAIYTDSEKKRHHPGIKALFGTFDWQIVSFHFTVPTSGYFNISLGTQQSTGTIEYRNLQIKTADSAVDIRRAANMGFVDKVESDGKGGWSDQGMDNDGSGFDFHKKKYANVPFSIIDPSANNGKSIMVFRSPKFPTGLKKASIRTSTPARCLYLLHTAAWTKTGITVGRIRINYANGKKQTIDVITGQDLDDQWNPSPKPNGAVGAKWPNHAGGSNGLYVSKFKLSKPNHRIVLIEFFAGKKQAVWIIAAATLSNKNYKFPVTADFTIRADQTWKPLKRPDNPCIQAGSALDFSYLNTNKIERLVINSKGRIARKSSPDKPFRLYGVVVGTKPKDYYTHLNSKKKFHCKGAWENKTSIDQQVRNLKLSGVNIARIHFNSFIYIKDGKVVLIPALLDRFEYFVAKCRENNIYIQIDTMNSHGFSKYSVYHPKGWKRNAKFNLLFDPAMRNEYKIGMKAILERVNPYTGTCLRDDPVLALINYNNEQEFAFIRDGKNYPWAKALPEWRKFIGDPNAPMFTKLEWSGKGAKARKINAFITIKWQKMLAWYNKVIKDEIGYKGLTSLWEMTGSMHYNNLRAELDLVMTHGYHAHGRKAWTAMSQGSDIGSSLAMLRTLLNMRIAGRPFCINEYAAYFWNQYRYEEGFTGGYVSFQGVDMLNRHNHPLDPTSAQRIMPWTQNHDPIAQVSVAQEALLYARGDAKEGRHGVRLTFSEKALNDASAWQEGVNSTESRMGLILKFGLERADLPDNISPPVKSDDIKIPLICGTKIMDHLIGFSQAIEIKNNRFDLSATIKQLKKQGILSKSNRSKNWYIQESSTNELYLDSRKKYMTINTPRFQGLCSQAGNKAVLKDVTIENLTANANVSVASLVPESTVGSAKRLILFYATNALNSNQSFADSSMVQMKSIGDNPTLIKCGRFKVTINNPNAADFKIYPLKMNGARRKAITPKSVSGNKLELDIDTAKLLDGPAVFFELAVK